MTHIVRTDISFTELKARLKAYEDRYGVPTAELESVFTDVEDEDLGMWLSLRSIHAHMTTTGPPPCPPH